MLSKTLDGQTNAECSVNVVSSLSSNSNIVTLLLLPQSLSLPSHRVPCAEENEMGQSRTVFSLFMLYPSPLRAVSPPSLSVSLESLRIQRHVLSPRPALSNMVGIGHMWLLIIKFEFHFLSHTSHNSNAPQLHATGDYHIGQCRYKTFHHCRKSTWTVLFQSPALSQHLEGDTALGVQWKPCPLPLYFSNPLYTRFYPSP